MEQNEETENTGTPLQLVEAEDVLDCKLIITYREQGKNSRNKRIPIMPATIRNLTVGDWQHIITTIVMQPFKTTPHCFCIKRRTYFVTLTKEEQ